MAKPKKKIYLGIDVGKRFFDAFISDVNQHQQFENNLKGFDTFLTWIHPFKSSVASVCLEATGGYEKSLLEFLVQHDFPACRINARWIRDFAKSKGYLAKTDKVDARVIAEYAATMSPSLYQKMDKDKEQLKELYLRRQQLVTMRSIERNHLEKASKDKIIKKSIERMIHLFDKEIYKIDEELEDWFDDHHDQQKQLDKMTEVKGVGKNTGMALLALMPELGHLNRQQICALAGVAPMNSDSGQHRGKRYTQGGRSYIRKALYMAALVAMQHNAKIKVFYDRLVAAGKAKKVALTACMRKLLIHLNGLMKNYFEATNCL